MIRSPSLRPFPTLSILAAVTAVYASPALGQSPCDLQGPAAAVRGLVHHETSVPLPGARITAAWPGGRAETVAGEGGLFTLCDLPADEDVEVRAEAMGFASQDEDLRLGRGEVRELDLVVDFGADAAGMAGGAVGGAEGAVAVRERVGASGRVVGRVVDAETGEPVEAALVGLGGEAYEATTSESGAFALERIPPGERSLRVRHIAYGEQEAIVEVSWNATLDVELRLAAEPIELEPLEVKVEGVRDRRLEIKGFYERRDWGEKLGLGHFFDREDIERRNPRLMTDMVADVPSIRLDCTHTYRSRTCRPYSARTPRHFCMWMNVYLDGIRVIKAVSPEVYRRKAIVYDEQLKLDELVNPSEVAALEIYPSSSSLPAEFGGSTGQCGSIVIWTRAGR